MDLFEIFLQEVLHGVQNLSFSTSSTQTLSSYYCENQEQRQRNVILLLPNEIMTDIAKCLSKSDYKQCMLVSKAWFFRFFGITYEKISFSQLSQINQFNSLVKNARSYFSEAATTTVMTNSVIMLSLNEVKKPSGSLYSDLDYKNEVVQVLNNLRNIQVLSLSWLQIHCSLCSVRGTSMDDNQYDDSRSSNVVWSHIRQLRWLKICKETLDSPQHLDKYLLMETYPNQYKPTTRSSSDMFERPEYVLHLLRGAPMLNSFTLAFTACKDRPWINIQYLEYIHQLCPLLHTFKLDNAPLYVKESFDQASAANIFATLVAEQMRNLELRSPVFYDFDQCISFHAYIKHIYKAIISLKICNIRIDISDNFDNNNSLSNVLPPVGEHLSTTQSTPWENLEQLVFMDIRSSNAFSICKTIIQAAGPNGKLTYIFISGKYVRKNKIHPIVVNFAWIQVFCPSLRTLDMSFISLFNSNADHLNDEILFNNNNNLPIHQGTLFRKLCLVRDTTNPIWNVQACKFDHESTNIKAITTF